MSDSDNQIEKPIQKKRNYVMTPGRQMALQKMREAREKKLKEKQESISKIVDPTPIVNKVIKPVHEEEYNKEIVQDVEEEIIIKKKNKPKQKIIYIESESEEEEPIIIKKTKNKKLIKKKEEEEYTESMEEELPEQNKQIQEPQKMVYNYSLKRMINFV